MRSTNENGMVLDRPARSRNVRRVRNVLILGAIIIVGILGWIGSGAVPTRPGILPDQVNVLTANGDNYRTSSNVHETQLTPATVRAGAFGKLGSFSVDGQVYAQPLYVSQLA